MVSDRISDVLTRVRNGYLAGNNYVRAVPVTKKSVEIVGVMLNEGIISEARLFKSERRGASGKHPGRAFLVLRLNYKLAATGVRKSIVLDLDRESKPSLKRYVTVKELRRLLKGSRQYILSTCFGVMNAGLALAIGLGGELLFSFRMSSGHSAVPFYVISGPRWLQREIAGLSRALQGLEPEDSEPEGSELEGLEQYDPELDSVDWYEDWYDSELES
jgi:small subunit ribosomal protein S8